MRLVILVLFSIVSSALCAEEDFDKQQILERIEPLGKVTVQEDANQQKMPEADSSAAVEKKVPGQAIYEQYCIVCHRDGLAGAPKFQDANDWKPRLAAKSMPQLLESIHNGLNAMPAKGTCIECSDDDFKAALNYMLPKS